MEEWGMKEIPVIDGSGGGFGWSQVILYIYLLYLVEKNRKQTMG